MALYDELGGVPAVAMALDRFYDKVMADQRLSPFFAGINLDQLKKTQSSFIAMALGGDSNYRGRTLREAHRRAVSQGLNNDVFNTFVGYFEEVLKEFGVAADKIGQVMSLLEGARAEVLDR